MLEYSIDYDVKAQTRLSINLEIDDRADDYAVFAVMRDNVGYVRVSKLTTRPLAEECFRNIVKTISGFSSLDFEQRACVFRTI